MSSSIDNDYASSSLCSVRKKHLVTTDAPVVIRFDDVCKSYRLYSNDLNRFFDGITGFKNNAYVKRLEHANDHLSFTIRKGESVAFIGVNGAGKSTTMKFITGVIFPDSGTIEVQGRVAAMLELSKGFRQELTGRENLQMRGLAMGMDMKEIDAIMDEVIAFADIGDYTDQPIRTYSSGMCSRLGFAFASAIKPDILVVDEALSVGDAAFRAKCINRIRDIMQDEGVTVCLVTHSNSTARDTCNRGIVLESGRAVFDGPIDDALEYYKRSGGIR